MVGKRNISKKSKSCKAKKRKPTKYCLNVDFFEPFEPYLANCGARIVVPKIEEFEFISTFKTNEVSELSIIDGGGNNTFWEEFFIKFPSFPKLEMFRIYGLDLELIKKVLKQSDNIKLMERYYFKGEFTHEKEKEDKKLITFYDKWKKVQFGAISIEETFIEMHSSYYDAKMESFKVWKKLVIPSIYFLNYHKNIGISIKKNKVTHGNKDITKLFSYTKFNETLWIYWILKKQFYLPKDIIHIILDHSIWLFTLSPNKKKTIFEKTWFPLSYFKKTTN